MTNLLRLRSVPEPRSTSLALLLLMLPACLLAACHGATLRAPESRWIRAETEHFTLYTDGSDRRATEQAEHLEQILSAYAQHGFALQGSLPLRLNVVVFDRPSDFSAYGGTELQGFIVGSLLFEPWVVLPARGRIDYQTVVHHELAHFVAYQGMQSQPSWLAEGIATYFETAHFDDQGRFVIGRVPARHWGALSQVGLLSAERLFARDADHRTGQFNATAWLAVHYLISQRGESFTRYQHSIASGRDHGSAWRESFADLPASQLDRALSHYLQDGEFAMFSRPVSTRVSKPSLHALSHADRLALDAILQLASARDGASGRRKAAQSLALARQQDPSQVQAAVLDALEFAGDPQAAREPLEQLTRVHPEHWLSWLAYGLTLAELGRLREVEPTNDPVAHVLALAPRQPYAQILAAMQHAERGEYESARERAARARRIAPTDVQLLLLQAELSAAIHDCAALASVTKVLEVVGHSQLSPTTRERLTTSARGCSSPLLSESAR